MVAADFGIVLLVSRGTAPRGLFAPQQRPLLIWAALRVGVGGRRSWGVAHQHEVGQFLLQLFLHKVRFQSTRRPTGAAVNQGAGWNERSHLDVAVHEAALLQGFSQRFEAS